MNKKLILFAGALCIAASTAIAAIVQSGWTSTGDASAARTALGIFSKQETTNVIVALTSTGSGVTNNQVLPTTGNNGLEVQAAGDSADITFKAAGMRTNLISSDNDFDIDVGSDGNRELHIGLNSLTFNGSASFNNPATFNSTIAGDGVGLFDIPVTGIQGLESAPATDKLLFYDVSGGGAKYLTIGGGLSVSGTEISAVTAESDQRKAAIITTNNVEDRSRIFVTGNASSLVNGEYRVRFYDATNFVGVWTNTASTNLILMNNPSNNANFASQPFVISGKYDGTDQFMYQENQETIGARGSWINPFTADGMTLFAGGANMAWGTNSTRNFALVDLSVGIDNPGLVGTNIIHVSEFGDDGLATRLNGYAFKSLFVAFTNAIDGDVILIEPGYYVTFPFHMNDGNPDILLSRPKHVHIIGSGPSTIVDVVHTDDYAVHHYQSRAIVPWENCSIGNFTLTNGMIALAQYNPVYGGSNVWVHDMTIYPPTHMVFTGGTGDPGAADQPGYFNVGMMASRVGPSNVVERVKVFSGQTGFGVQTLYNNQNAELTLIDCEAYCSPEYAAGDSNIWATVPSIAPNVGGMLPIALLAQYPDSQTKYDLNLNIHGGKFVSLNGGTNVGAYVGGEVQSNRNASLWISRAYTNNLRIRFTGVPEFYYGSSNGVAYPVLDESTNGKTVLSGYYYSKAITQITNRQAWAENPSVNSVLTNKSGGPAGWFPIASLGGGSTSPAGSDTQVQYNNAGVFGAASSFTFSSLNGGNLTVGNSITTSTNITTGEARAAALVVTNTAWFSKNGVSTLITSNNITTTNLTVQGTAALGDVTIGSLSGIGASQAVYGSGTFATSTGTMATMDFGTTDPTLTVSVTGTYMISAGLNGITTSSSGSGTTLRTQIAVNGTLVSNSETVRATDDTGLGGLVMPYSVRIPVVYVSLTAGDTVALRWQAQGSAASAYQASYADLSILRIQ